MVFHSSSVPKGDGHLLFLWCLQVMRFLKAYLKMDTTMVVLILFYRLIVFYTCRGSEMPERKATTSSNESSIF